EITVPVAFKRNVPGIHRVFLYGYFSIAVHLRLPGKAERSFYEFVKRIVKPSQLRVAAHRTLVYAAVARALIVCVDRIGHHAALDGGNKILAEIRRIRLLV